MKILLVEKARGWTAELSETFPSHLLRKGLHLSLPSAMVRPVPATAAIFSDVVSWSVSWSADSEEPQLTVEVREVRPSRFAEISQDNQFLLVAVSVVLTLLGFGLFAWAIFAFPEPAFIWSWVGRHVRLIVGILLVALGFVLAWRTGAYRKGSNFLQNYLAFLLTVLCMLAALIWIYVSNRPASIPSTTAGDVAYVEYLLARARTTWPVIAAVLPWSALLFQALGYAVTSQVAGFLAKRGKREA